MKEYEIKFVENKTIKTLDLKRWFYYQFIRMPTPNEIISGIVKEGQAL
jgi:hypothetical protein